MNSNEIRSKFLSFFKEKGHAVIPGASLIPENDASVLFTTAGMQPLVPYLLGAKHPAGTRLCDVQKCVRTVDIDEVGDNSHCTFFEMLGNWSLGDYFKKEAISWSWEFLTGKDYLNIPREKLYFTVFAGDENSPRDNEAYQYWRDMGVEEDHIFFLPKENNWWIAGTTGPCGPDTEMFIDTGKEKCSDKCDPSCDCGKYIEIWNDVFMQYNRTAGDKIEPLKQKNVDTGLGLERILTILNGVESVYETDLFTDIISKIEELSGRKYKENDDTKKAFRIIADHIRTSTFILGDVKGVTPSNVDQGYILRRLIRRAVRFGRKINLPENSTSKIADVVIGQYANVYPLLKEKKDFIDNELILEEGRFQKTLKQGLKEFDKLTAKMNQSGNKNIDGQQAFHLYDTFGFPIELTIEMAKENGFSVDKEGFDENFKKHQQVSHAGATQKFKGGLADHNVETARLHTATHLLHAALRKVLGNEVAQKGSNITTERLRFDFSFPRKVTKEELVEVEKLVNEAIQSNTDIICEEMPLEKAKTSGAIGLFESKYGDMVKVYTMGKYSKEICGGPHASNTKELGHFKIKKEESSSAGVRRIKAILEK